VELLRGSGMAILCIYT